MSELRMAEEEAQAPMGLEETSSRVVAGRLFRLQAGVWKQAGIREGDDVLKVAPFSRAYFDLLDRVPELKAFAKELDQFEIQGAALRIRIEDGGPLVLSQEELSQARTGFLPGDGGRK
jgi:hypothetical protein